MKFMEIVASLAIAGTVSAVAVPQPEPPILDALDGVLTSLTDVIEGLAGKADLSGLLDIEKCMS